MRNEGLPTEVAEFLDRLAQHDRPDLSPRRKEELDEIQRRRNAGILTAPATATRRPRRQANPPWVVMRDMIMRILRTYGFLIVAMIMFIMATWDVARPLGLAAVALSALYFEHRAEVDGRSG
jgi:hypothetical protein